MSNKKERVQSKILPFGVFYRPSGQQENWLRTGKYYPEVPPLTPDQIEVPESLAISQLKKREDNPNISLGSLEESGFLKNVDSDR